MKYIVQVDIIHWKGTKTDHRHVETYEVEAINEVWAKQMALAEARQWGVNLSANVKDVQLMTETAPN